MASSLFAQRSLLVDRALNASDVTPLPMVDWGCAEAHASTTMCPHLNHSVGRPALRWYALGNIDKWLVSNFFCDVCAPHARTFVAVSYTHLTLPTKRIV